jgi:hypothetical protein
MTTPSHLLHVGDGGRGVRDRDDTTLAVGNTGKGGAERSLVELLGALQIGVSASQRPTASNTRLTRKAGSWSQRTKTDLNAKYHGK